MASNFAPDQPAQEGAQNVTASAWAHPAVAVANDRAEVAVGKKAASADHRFDTHLAPTRVIDMRKAAVVALLAGLAWVPVVLGIMAIGAK